MGINFVCNETRMRNWSYGCFGRFRERLASERAINLDSMIGFGGELKWPSIREEPLVPFFNHSDCDGEWSAFECSVIEPALRKHLKAWPDAPDGTDESWWKNRGLELCDLMQEAIRTKSKVEVQ